MAARAANTLGRSADAGTFRAGFAAMLPLWLVAIPTGIAYAVAARDAGLAPWAIGLASLLVFSSTGQLGALALLGAGASPLAIVGTAMVLNAQLVLIGLTIGRATRLANRQRLLLAAFLTDAAFAVGAGGAGPRPAAILGAGVGMYLAWNLGTVAGIAAGGAIPDLGRAGLDFTLPLLFIGLLVPRLRDRATLATAIVAATLALLLGRLAPASVTILAAAGVACLLGARFGARAA